MSARWLSGGLLTCIGLGWGIGNRVLLTSDPDHWGGPNIGGGALLLLAGALVVAGVFLLATGFRNAARGVRALVLVAVALVVTGIVLTYVVTAGDRTEPTGLGLLQPSTTKA